MSNNIYRPNFGESKKNEDPKEIWEKNEETLGFESSLQKGSIEEMVQSIWKRKEVIDEIIKILDNTDDISVLTEKEIQKYSFLYFINKIIENDKFSPELYSCSEYISKLITKQILNYIDIHQNIMELLKNPENPDFQSAGDIQLLRYISKYDKRKRTPLTEKDLINGAEMYYLGAYNAQKVKVGIYMHENLNLLQEIVDIRNLLEKLFPQRVFQI